jgi:hypothetical protein
LINPARAGATRLTVAEPFASIGTRLWVRAAARQGTLALLGADAALTRAVAVPVLPLPIDAIV